MVIDKIFWSRVLSPKISLQVSTLSKSFIFSLNHIVVADQYTLFIIDIHIIFCYLLVFGLNLLSFEEQRAVFDMVLALSITING